MKLPEKWPEEVLKGWDFRILTHRPYGIFSLRSAREFRVKAEPTEALFAEVRDRLIARLGEPREVHPYYGLVWKAGNLFVTWNFCPVDYDCVAPGLFFFAHLPRGRTLPYAEYRGVDEAVRTAFERRGLGLDCLPHYAKGGFLYFVPSGRQVVVIREKLLEVAGTGPQGEQISRRQAIDRKRPETVAEALEKCL